MFKFFYKDDCPKCPAAKKVIEQLVSEGHQIEIHNMDSVDGLAEGAFYQVMSVPTLIAVDAQETEEHRWVGEMPIRVGKR